MLIENLVVASLILVAAAVAWFGRRQDGPAVAACIAGLIGGAFWIWTGGLRLIDPREIGWSMRLDWQWHFLGWHMVRHEPWHLPPGRIVTEFFPVGSAIAYTDSLPLVAFVLKPVAFLLPEPFQYLGAWLLVCYTLQGVCAAVLIRQWTRALFSSVAGATLVIFNPVLLNRVGHVALCSHWLILLGFLLYFRRSSLAPARAVIYWSGLALIASLIHPYLWLMVMALATAAAADAWQRGASPGRAAAFLACVAALGASGAWISGWFLIGSANAGSEGFGTLSMNLLGPFAANGWSAIFGNLPVNGEQTYEGFNYLGFGAIALIVIAGLECLRRLPDRRTLRAIAPLGAACGALALFALSNRITFGHYVVAEVPLPKSAEAWLSAARATGRFFWPAGYFLTLMAIACVVKRCPARWAGALLTAATLLQVYDLHAQIRSDRAVRSDPAWYAWDDLSRDPSWKAAAEGRRHIALIPPDVCGVEAAPYAPLGVFAGRHHLTLNSGHAARFDLASLRADCAAVAATIAQGSLDPSTIYVVHPSLIGNLRSASKLPLQCWPWSGAWACIVPQAGPKSQSLP